MSNLRLRVLGPLRAWLGDSELDLGPPQQAQLLAMLLARSGEVSPLEQLVEALWGNDPPLSAVNTIHKRIGAIRRLLEPGISPRDSGSHVLRRGDGYVWSTGDSVLDVDIFRARVAAGRAAIVNGHDDEALELLSGALRLWAGPSRVNMGSHAASAPVFAALDSEFVSAALFAAPIAVERNQPETVLASLELAASINPLNEEVQAAIISTLGAAGRRADAIATFIEVRRLLVEELGIDPSPALAASYRRIVDFYSDPRLPNQPRRGVDGPHDRAVAAEPFRVADFRGRDVEIERIRAFAFTRNESNTGAALLITGPPGVGKTTTALEAVRRGSARGSRLFADLHGFDEAPLTPLEVLRSLLAQVNPQDAPPISFDDAALAWDAAAGSGEFVVVLDNASSESQVRAVLAVEAPLRVIITSRRSLPGLELAERVPLGPLPRGESESLLTALMGSARSVRSQTAKLAELCGDLPLALRIAGARLASRPLWSVDDLIDRLEDERKRLAQLVAGDLAVETAFALSYNALHPTTRVLFRSLAGLHDSVFTAEMVAAMHDIDPYVSRDQLDALADLGLIEATAGDRYRIHDLLRIYAADRSRVETSGDERRIEQERLDGWLLSRTIAAARVFPDVWEMTPAREHAGAEEVADAREWLTVQSAHWHGALTRAADGGNHELIVESATALARISSVWEHFIGWTHVHSLGASSAGAIGADELQVKQMLALAIAVAVEAPGPGDAETAARRALEAAESLGNPRWVAWARSVLADALSVDGDGEGALRESRAAASTFRQLGDLNGEMEARSWTLNTLSVVDLAAATAEAEALIATVAGMEDPDRVLHPSTLLNAYSSAARLFLSQGRFDDALAISARMAELHEPALGGGGYSARASFVRGFALLGLDRFQEARGALEQALAWQSPYLPDSWGERLRGALASIPGE